ncbi:EAL domain-containing protein [Pseudolysobacter antarcticus]|uniref:EAL domain-containing protein n=1 Tax=Pseudolysobacter antarcticus TaxID=2511995 RepID=A0A411HHD5_9GAMM|nr:EAL domain-containing response regulator [Pseudolysobacter antarcticus]QBB69942.1 EAL domain-containing protein [Pseudolysobacter antarcticus]
MTSVISGQVSALSALVVDDDPLMTEIVSALLRDFALVDIETAQDGNEALAMLSLRHVDLMVCDLNMPGMDGALLLKHLADFPSPPALILLSGEHPRVLEASGQLAATLGLTVLGVLQKPVDRVRLAELLQRYNTQFPKREKSGATIELSKQDLRRGLKKGTQRLAYQPKIDLKSGELVGAEALLRWKDPELGNIPPNHVVSSAERHGFIDELTLAILHQAVMDRAKLVAADLPINIAVNLSLHNLRMPDMVEHIIQIVTAKGDKPANFTLEITETCLIEDLATALEMLIRLRMNGFQLAIDDYGTGASTMQFLQQFPTTEMKIDRSFVVAAPLSEHGCAFLSTAIELGTKLGQVTVAEGIETFAQCTLATKLGCQQGQGFYFSEPLPLDAFIAWARSYQPGWLKQKTDLLICTEK